MKQKYFLIPFMLLLAGCGSPLGDMTPQQISTLSDDQLCAYRNNYPYEEKTELEIGKRKLNCDPATRECQSTGHMLGTPAMALCVKQTRENWAMQEHLEQQQQQMIQQQQQIQRDLNWQRQMLELERMRQNRLR